MMDLVSFLSRVTGKTFPWVYWSPFEDFFIFRLKKHIILKRLKFGVKLSYMFKKNQNLGKNLSKFISSIIQECPDTLTMRFTAKPYILWKGLFHRICSKFYKVKHGHDFFWPPASWRLVEAKNTFPRPKYAWRSQSMEKSV